MKKIIVLLFVCVMVFAENKPKVDYEESWFNGISLEAYKTI